MTVVVELVDSARVLEPGETAARQRWLWIDRGLGSATKRAGATAMTIAAAQIEMRLTICASTRVRWNVAWLGTSFRCVRVREVVEERR